MFCKLQGKMNQLNGLFPGGAAFTSVENNEIYWQAPACCWTCSTYSAKQVALFQADWANS